MRVTLGLLLVLLPLGHAQADLPWPRLDRLSALGVNQGSEVDIELAGADLEGLTG